MLLYDEPTTGLDPINTARVNHLITGLQESLNITSIVVTHDMKSAFSISDRIAMVHSGRIICIGTVDEFQASSDPRVSDFIEGRAPVKEGVETLLDSLSSRVSGSGWSSADLARRAFAAQFGAAEVRA